MSSAVGEREAVRSVAGARPLLAYIDCVRGYAVTLVVTCHLAYEFPQLPYAVHRLAVMGWHGVQMFFLASALTLLMSWRHEVGRLGSARVAAFLLRRFFRIAPAYYAAAWLYYELAPPPGGFDAVQVAASVAFVNGWSPALLPTVAGAWAVVPGGWSISVEFTFYLLFPLFAALATSLRRALVLFGVCLLAGFVANCVAAPILLQSYAPKAVDNFLYFWFPNQMAVFALGGVLYFVQLHLSKRPASRAARLFARHGTAIPALALSMFFAAAWLRLPHWTGLTAPYIPLVIVVSLCLAAFILALSLAGRSLFVNPLAARMGKVSFSAYLVHFAVLRLAVADHPSVFHADAVGPSAVGAYVIACGVVLALTYGLAWCGYRALELPMMELGRKLTRSPLHPLRTAARPCSP